jgi:hypothetical protein
MSNSEADIVKSIDRRIDRRKEIINLLDQIEDYTYLTLEQEDKFDIRDLVKRIKELF